MEEYIFIHIPKTGGSSFVRALQESVPDFDKSSGDNTHVVRKVKNVLVKHINFASPGRCIICPDIITNWNSYKNYKIFTIVRDPVDRLLSEFIFQFYTLHSNPCAKKIRCVSVNGVVPQTFEEYIKHPILWNYQVGFLCGRNIGDLRLVTEEDFNNVLIFFSKPSVHAGTTDNYPSFIERFNSLTEHNITLNNQIKKAPDEIKDRIRKTLTQETKDFIYKTNSIDYRLYLHVKNENQLKHC